MTSSRPTARTQSLDVLRAIAVILVIGRHQDLWSPPGIAGRIMSLWNRGGWIGVDLFFVLSGFLVSGLLFREYQKHGSIQSGRFLLRRGFKIYPGFYVFLGSTTAFFAFMGGPIVVRRLLAEALFVQNYFPGIWLHTWSLAIEEHFYLAISLLLSVAARTRSPRPFAFVPPFALAVAAICLGLRIATSLLCPFTWMTHFIPTHLRIDALMLGVLIAYLYNFRPALLARVTRHVRPIGAGSLVLLSPAFLLPAEDPWMHTIGFTSVSLGAACLLIASLEARSKLLAPLARTVAYVGACSYQIYLWHLPVRDIGLWALTKAFGVISPPTLAAGYVLGSIGFGIVMTLLVEAPFLRLRDRLVPSRSPAPVGQSPRDGVAA